MEVWRKFSPLNVNFLSIYPNRGMLPSPKAWQGGDIIEDFSNLLLFALPFGTGNTHKSD